MNAEFTTRDPYSNQTLKTWAYATREEVEQTLNIATQSHHALAKTTYAQRKALVLRFAEVMGERQEAFAELMAQEMGKPLVDGISEVKKCITALKFFADFAESQLKSREIPVSTGEDVYVLKQSLGPLLAIMPWNFPLWQVIRFVAPNMLVGNPMLLKHSDLTPGTSALLGQCAEMASQGLGIPFLLNIRLSHDQVPTVINDPRIRGITFTGSVKGGQSVATLAGAAGKKIVLELGGSDAYLVLADADVQAAAKICAEARLINGGQSCVAAKRFFVDEKIFPEFMKHFAAAMGKGQAQNPLSPDTKRGPLAARRFQTQLQDQVRKLIQAGAKPVAGEGLCADFSKDLPSDGPCSFPPTVLQFASFPKAAWDTELFGPVACVWSYKNLDEAIAAANNAIFGLGAAVFSKDLMLAKTVASKLECGMVAINNFVRSDAQWPFGGVKESGTGRELGLEGLNEFINFKSIVSRNA